MENKQQSEALRLADICATKGLFAVEDELRRLHTESEKHLQELAAYRFTVDNLRARVAELEAQLAESTHPTQQGLEQANCKSGNWLTVVYRDIRPGDEARTIGEHPKVSALSWSHALNDRDAAIAAQAKQGGAVHG